MSFDIEKIMKGTKANPESTGFIIRDKMLNDADPKLVEKMKKSINEQFGNVSAYTPNWNVISEEEFKNKTLNVFHSVANALRNTLGPFGSTTIIEKYGEMHITKDGWQVLKSIHFDNSIENNILMMLLRISQQVVLKVGDGSTSSVIAANAILNRLNASEKLKTIRPRDLMTELTKCVNKVSSELLKNATPINKETYNEIYKIAYIATNGDHEISSMIKDIYIKTNNPAIEFVESKTDKTEYEVIDGYRGNITYIDGIFATDDSMNCVVKKPMFLMFDYKIDMETLPMIQAALGKSVDADRRLIVVAPAYDQRLLEWIKIQTTTEMRANHGMSYAVYTRVSLVNNVAQSLYNDFAVMTGGEIIREQFIENETILADIPTMYMGECDYATIGAKTTFISGFYNRNEEMYKKVYNDAVAQYKSTEEDYMNRGLIDTRLNEMKQRVSKLTGSAGIIRVGGYTTLEKRANFDLVEDAIKACESAYVYGYNIGGSMVIPWTIHNGIYSPSESQTPDIEVEIMNIIYDAFIDVFKTIYANKYKNIDNTDVEEIITTLVTSPTPVAYNIIDESITDDIINSCITDIEILKASISIVSLLISSNQYVSINMTSGNA